MRSTIWAPDSLHHSARSRRCRRATLASLRVGIQNFLLTPVEVRVLADLRKRETRGLRGSLSHNIFVRRIDCPQQYIPAVARAIIFDHPSEVA